MENNSKERSSVPFKVKCWEKSVLEGDCSIRSVSEIHRICKKNGNHLFSLLDVDVVDPEGDRLPNIVFIRGNAVIAVPLLINSETGEERFLMVRQRRIGSGKLSLEFPAGMLDNPDDNPVDVAVRELFEETGLKIERNLLQPLIDRPLYSSAGASDEAVYFFGCRVNLTKAGFSSFYRTTGGNPEENEKITIELLNRSEAQPQVTSLQAMLGFYLFDNFFKK